MTGIIVQANYGEEGVQVACFFLQNISIIVDMYCGRGGGGGRREGGGGNIISI